MFFFCFTLTLKYAFWILHPRTQKQPALPPIGGKQFYLLPDNVGSAQKKRRKVKKKKKKKKKGKRKTLPSPRRRDSSFFPRKVHIVWVRWKEGGDGEDWEKIKAKKIGCKVCRITVRDRRETWASRRTAAAASLSLLQPRKTHRICLQPLDKILQPSVSIHSILIDTTTHTYMLHTHSNIPSHRYFLFLFFLLFHFFSTFFYLFPRCR